MLMPYQENLIFHSSHNIRVIVLIELDDKFDGEEHKKRAQFTSVFSISLFDNNFMFST
jgi:hypothetical protein